MTDDDDTVVLMKPGKLPEREGGVECVMIVDLDKVTGFFEITLHHNLINENIPAVTRLEMLDQLHDSINLAFKKHRETLDKEITNTSH